MTHYTKEEESLWTSLWHDGYDADKQNLIKTYRHQLQKAREDAAWLGFQASGEGFNGEYCRGSDEYIKKYLKDKLNQSEIDQDNSNNI